MLACEHVNILKEHANLLTFSLKHLSACGLFYSYYSKLSVDKLIINEEWLI